MSEVDRCERAIRRAILAGELAPGERLPPERALAERLGVNRTTLRAALSRVAAARLLRVRQGSGYVVQDYRRHAGLDALAELVEIAQDQGDARPLLADVLELRRRVASMALARIATRRTPGAGPSDLTKVRSAVDRLEVLAEEGADVAALAEADLDCTAAILELTGSPVLGLLLNPVHTVIRRVAELRRVLYQAPETNVAAYRALLVWLEAPAPLALDAILAQLEARDARHLEQLGASQ